MIEAVVIAHGIDRDQVFVTGLSAGGAIIAGLPYGCASNVQEAFGAMRSRGRTRPDALAALIQRASGHEGPWPKVSVWHGSGDGTVNPDNADAIVEQWLPLHGIALSASTTDVVDGYPHRAWRDAGGRIMVEAYSITGMGHGTPLDASGADPAGVAGPHMLDVAISSSRRIAEFWGLTADTIAQPDAVERVRDAGPPVPGTSVAHRAMQAQRLYPEPKPAPGVDVRRIIDDALRAGGLLK